MLCCDVQYIHDQTQYDDGAAVAPAAHLTAAGMLMLLPVALSGPCRAVLRIFTATHCLRSAYTIMQHGIHAVGEAVAESKILSESFFAWSFGWSTSWTARPLPCQLLRLCI